MKRINLLASSVALALLLSSGVALAETQQGEAVNKLQARISSTTEQMKAQLQDKIQKEKCKVFI